VVNRAEETLRDVFGLTGFRGGQQAVVEAMLAGRDVLVVAPTGSGKSLSYWVPAVAGGGLTLVISPLIALMRDQVDRLHSLGVAAACVNSSIGRAEQQEALAEAKSGRLRLLYVAPERLAQPGFQDLLGRITVTRIVVDEAHCISSWGHDFRPDYRLLGQTIRALGHPPTAGFTATATPRVRADIVASLLLRDPLLSVSGFSRPNLTLRAQRCRGVKGKMAELLRILRPGSGRAIVYAGTRAATEAAALLLVNRGFDAAAYHAGLPDQERERIQLAFRSGQIRVLVATIAFGMGVDLPDVRQVVHLHLPGSVESYYQEAGRAGRDGASSECVLLWSPADRDLHSYFIEQAQPGPETDLKRAAYSRLEQMLSYASVRTCRHARISQYFGESAVPSTCSACDNCLEGSGPEQVIPGAIVGTVLRAVAQFSGRTGASNLAAVLGGRSSSLSRSQPWILDLAVFGSLRGTSEDEIRDLIRGLIEAGALSQSSGKYPVVALTPRGRDALTGSHPLSITRAARQSQAKAESGAGLVVGSGHGGMGTDPVLSRLRRWRAEVARAQGMPAYLIFHDRTLAELARRRPNDLAELAQVPGIGPAKSARWGLAVLRILAAEPG